MLPRLLCQYHQLFSLAAILSQKIHLFPPSQSKPSEQKRSMCTVLSYLSTSRNYAHLPGSFHGPIGRGDPDTVDDDHRQGVYLFMTI